jgi:hypothetical protein
MAEKREFWCEILLKFSGKETLKLRLARAEQWAHELAAPGLHRVQRGSILSGRWVSGSGGPEFVPLPRVADMVLAELEGVCPSPPVQPPHPLLKQRARVRWRPSVNEGLPNAVQTWAASDPIRAYSGEWMIYLTGGVGWVPCDEVTPLDAFGREVQP